MKHKPTLQEQMSLLRQVMGKDIVARTLITNKETILIGCDISDEQFSDGDTDIDEGLLKKMGINKPAYLG